MRNLPVLFYIHLRRLSNGFTDGGRDCFKTHMDSEPSAVDKP